MRFHNVLAASLGRGFYACSGVSCVAIPTSEWRTADGGINKGYPESCAATGHCPKQHDISERPLRNVKNGFPMGSRNLETLDRKHPLPEDHNETMTGNVPATRLTGRGEVL